MNRPPLAQPTQPTQLTRLTTQSVVFLTAVTVWCAPLHAALNYEDSLKELAEGVTIEAVKAKKERIAVVDFTDSKGQVTLVGQFLAEELATHLSILGELKVVDRTLLNSTLKKQRVTQLDASQAKAVKKVAKVVRADVFVTGSFVEVSDGLLVTATLVGSSGSVIGAARSTLPTSGPLASLLSPPDSTKGILIEPKGSESLPAGLGAHMNEFYQMTVIGLHKLDQHVKLDVVFESLSPRNMKVMCKLQETYLEDENGGRWRQDSSENRESPCVKGLELSSRKKERATLTFSAPDQAMGTVFTLRYLETAPRHDAEFTIDGLKSDSAELSPPGSSSAISPFSVR
ncbi:MAG: FlgO family outer membrane protein [Nitrospiraceae bacterium]